jgi:hypothetical protein
MFLVKMMGHNPNHNATRFYLGIDSRSNNHHAFAGLATKTHNNSNYSTAIAVSVHKKCKLQLQSAEVQTHAT